MFERSLFPSALSSRCAPLNSQLEPLTRWFVQERLCHTSWVIGCDTNDQATASEGTKRLTYRKMSQSRFFRKFVKWLGSCGPTIN